MEAMPGHRQRRGPTRSNPSRAYLMGCAGPAVVRLIGDGMAPLQCGPNGSFHGLLNAVDWLHAIGLFNKLQSTGMENASGRIMDRH